MPLYKNLPREKKRAVDLPLYRPIDRILLLIWRRRRTLILILTVVVPMALIYGGLRLYGSHAADKARRTAIDFLRSGQKAFKEKRYEDAIRSYQSVAERPSLSPLFRIAADHNLARVLYQKGERKRVLAILEKLSVDPENVNRDYTRLLLAKVYGEIGEKEKARELYKALSEAATAGGSVYFAIQEEAKEQMKKWEALESKKKGKSGKKK